MVRRTAEAGRKRISYLAVDPTAVSVHRPARTVLFLHAFPLHAEMWEPALGRIPDGWRALAPDLRGFGGTAGSSTTVSEMAGDVVDLLDVLDVAGAAVIGCSMGGYVAFELMRSAPGYVKALGLVSTRAGADSEQGRASRLTMIATVDAGGVAAVAEQMTPKLLGETTRRERPDLVAHVRAMIESNGPDGVKGAVRAMMDRPDSTPMLRGIGVPTLVVHGTEDGLIPPTEGEAMHREIRGSQLALLAGSGHLPGLEQPDVFCAALWRFLEPL